MENYKSKKWLKKLKPYINGQKNYKICWYWYWFFFFFELELKSGLGKVNISKKTDFGAI